MKLPPRLILAAALLNPLMAVQAAPTANPVLPEIVTIGMMAQVELCQQRQPTLAGPLRSALAGWSSRNGNLIESAKNFAGYAEAMADARKSLIQNGATFSMETCTALLNSLNQQ